MVLVIGLFRRSLFGLVTVVVAGLAFASALARPAAALTLDDALTQAYLHNPSLQSARFELAGVDERVPAAWGNWKPRAEALTGGGYARSENENVSSSAFSQDSGPVAVLSLRLTQPVFDYSSVAGVRQAKLEVQAQRAALRQTEQDVLLRTVNAYLDMVAAEATLTLAREYRATARRDVETARRRFREGFTTDSPVLETEARVAFADARIAEADFRLAAARQAFMTIVGEPAVDLREPSFPATVPADLDTVLAASRSHPAITAAEFAEQAAQEAVKVRTGQTLPQVFIQSDIDARTQSILGVVRTPLYDSRLYPQVRAEKEAVRSRREQFEIQRREVRNRAITAWESLQSMRARVTAHDAEVQAARAAVGRLRREHELGMRPITDLLINQLGLQQAETNLKVAKIDTLRAAYKVLEAMGKMTALDLALEVPYFDETAHYDRVSGSWFGYGESID
ncbi:MAG: TolC family protein [Rhodoplanes sp.]